jgi:plastocyanin
MHRRLLIAALTALLVLPATALGARKPVDVKMGGVYFDGRPNVKKSFKLGGSLRFVWKDGFHDVLTQSAPKKAKRINTGAATDSHKPVTFKPTKKGRYVLYCLPHRALGMVLTLTVT